MPAKCQWTIDICYHEALEALCQPAPVSTSAVSTDEAGEINGKKVADYGRGQEMFISSCTSSSPKPLKALQSLRERVAEGDPFEGWHNRRYNCLARYAITCLNALKKHSISAFFPIVRRMWFGKSGEQPADMDALLLSSPG